MNKLILEMEKPKVCITKDGYYGNCPMDRVWCVQRNAPSGTKMGDAYVEMTDNIPSWCPIKGVLPEEHGDLIDRDAVKKEILKRMPKWCSTAASDGFQFCSRREMLYPISRAKAVIAAERKDDEQIH